MRGGGGGELRGDGKGGGREGRNSNISWMIV